MFNEHNVIAITIMDRYANLLRLGAAQAKIQFTNIDTQPRLILNFGKAGDVNTHTMTYDLTLDTINALRVALETDAVDDLDMSKELTLSLYGSNQGILPVKVMGALCTGMSNYARAAIRHNLMSTWAVIKM